MKMTTHVTEGARPERRGRTWKKNEIMKYANMI